MEPLTETETDTLRGQLETLEVGLQATIERASGASKTVDLDEPIGRLSRMDAIQQQKMASAGRAANQQRLTQVRRALAAIGEGVYGFCVRCEEPIGVRRLTVQPEAPLCIRCKAVRERGG